MSAFVWWNGTFALVQSTGRTLSDGLSSPYEILRVPRVQAALNWASRAVSMTSFSLRTPWIPLYAVMCCGCCMTPRWQRLETWDRFLENSTDMKCTQISMIQHDTTIAREGPWLAPLFFVWWLATSLVCRVWKVKCHADDATIRRLWGRNKRHLYPVLIEFSGRNL